VVVSSERPPVWLPTLPLRWTAALLVNGRATLLATAPLALTGMSLLPDLHSSLRLPAWLALAGVIGLGGELSARLVAPETVWRRGWGTFWFVPAGAVLLAIVWFSGFPDRPRTLAPLAALAVVGSIWIQRVEVAGPQSLRAGAHAISIGLAFAIAFVVYTTVAHAQTYWALPVVLATTLAVALILLRDVRAGRLRAVQLAGVSALIVAELAFVLAGGPITPWVCGALLVLTLYALAGVSHAALEGASRPAYVELALVTAGGLFATVLGATRV
jgi:hypothetical protein